MYCVVQFTSRRYYLVYKMFENCTSKELLAENHYSSTVQNVAAVAKFSVSSFFLFSSDMQK